MPLSGFRVLEIGSSVALSYCGKLFADFGADVIKLEPPQGDPLRSAPPILTNREGGLFAWLNTNKHSVTDTNDTRAALLARADVLLDARAPREIAAEHAAWRREYPGLTITAISWFGETGPYRDFAASEAVVRALAGLVALTGPAEGPPLIATDHQSGVIAGLAAFIPTAAGLYGKAARRFSISLHEAMVNIAEYEAAVAWDAGVSRKRPGVNRFGRNYPVGIYPTKQGMIGVTIVTPQQWQGFCTMLGMPEVAREPRYSINIGRLQHAAEIDALCLPVWAERTAEQWFKLGLKYKLPMAMVPTMAELLHQQVLRDRGAFVPVTIGDVTFEAPNLPQYLERTPPRKGGRAPLRPQDDAPARPVGMGAEGTPPTPSSLPTPPGADGEASRAGTRDGWQPTAACTLPLEGVRIIDLTMGWAGPTGARHLADLGAEIIKVEACQYPDWWRGTDLRAEFIAEQRYEKIQWFQLMNRNKLAVTLDLTRPDGVALLKRLVAGAHAVIENYSSEVLRNLKLDYNVLKEVRPGLVMLSMPAFGSNNPWSSCRAYGSTLEQASGLPCVTGCPEDPPTMNQTAYGDPVGGFNASAALMVALLHQQRTGEGQNIDLSQVECMVSLTAPFLIEQSATGHSSPRIGNRHPVHAPQGCFRCAGDDAWLAVTVLDDTAWRALCSVIGRADLAGLDTAARRTAQDDLEAAISTWTAHHSADDAMAALQALGVAAGVARRPFDLDTDPHLVARGFWHRVDRPFIGPHWQSSPAFRENEAAYPVRRVAPTLGQDNGAILGGRLGLDAAELERLAMTDIIGTVPKPKRQY
jgi:crotonobetainyl-CoA:carnitine CoA-transferase CaiB-like acyl-CoA transferase